MTFLHDSLALRSERLELRVYAIELRIERIKAENRGVHTLRERRVLTLQRSDALLIRLWRRRSTRSADDSADGADSDGDEKAGLQSVQPPHERGTVPQSR